MVRPKKHLGQHFLKDQSVAERIALALPEQLCPNILEIGPGTGVLTQYLLQRPEDLTVVEIDSESVDYLHIAYPALRKKILEADFLRMDLSQHFDKEVAIAGNFPYNISSQIVFKMLEYRQMIPAMAGMFQKEVAERLVADEGSKTYGILSVLCAVYYEREYLFTVEPHLFNPPPKVQSGVIRMLRRNNPPENLDEKLLWRIVKTAFNQRRKTLRNALKSLNLDLSELGDEVLSKRAEQISPGGFLEITYKLQQNEF